MDSQVRRGMGYYLGSGSNSGSDLVERVAATCKIWELGIKNRMRKKKERGTTSATHPIMMNKQRRRKCTDRKSVV